MFFITFISIISLPLASPYGTGSLGKIVYSYRGNIFFITHSNLVYSSDGLYILGVKVIISINSMENDLVTILVNISGPLYYDPMLANCSSFSLNVLFEACNTSSLARIINESYKMSLTYMVNASNNYAWLNGHFIGFFPLYVVPDIDYDNATQLKYVYLGEELALITEHDKPVPIRVKRPYKSGFVELRCIAYNNTYVNLCLLHHYPLYVWGLLPIKDNKFALVYLEVDDSMINVLASVNDYPASIEYVDYVRVGLLMSVVALIIVGMYGVVRRLRRGKG